MYKLLALINAFIITFKHYNLSGLSVITLNLEGHAECYYVNCELSLYTWIRESITS